MSSPDELSPIYYRVSPSIWRQEWTEKTRHLALYLLTCQHRTVEGLFVLPKGYIAEDLQWSLESLGESFAELVVDDFIDYDEERRVCFIVKAIRYQPPRNPNMQKSAIRRLQNVPITRLDDRFLASAIRYKLSFAESLRQSLPERFGKPQLFSALLSSTHSAGGREASPGAPPAHASYCTCGAELQVNGDGTGETHCPVCAPAVLP